MVMGKRICIKCTRRHKQTYNKNESCNNFPTFVIGRRGKQWPSKGDRIFGGKLPRQVWMKNFSSFCSYFGMKKKENRKCCCQKAAIRKRRHGHHKQLKMSCHIFAHREKWAFLRLKMQIVGLTTYEFYIFYVWVAPLNPTHYSSLAE